MDGSIKHLWIGLLTKTFNVTVLMLKSISLENFKCFKEEATFNLKKINVFTGYNGRGKSSVFQSLLVLSQSLHRYGNIETLEINGDLVQLGVLEDLINCEKKTDSTIRFHLKSDIEGAEDIKLGYKEKEDSERLGKLDELEIDGIDYFNREVSAIQDDKNTIMEIHKLSNYPTQFHSLLSNYNYVSADRKGPTLYEEKRDLTIYNPIGKNGENLMNAIAKKKTLQDKVNRAVSYIMDGGEISINGEYARKTDILSLNFKTSNSSENKFKSINCGYGYSYVLSIVANVLTINKGILFIENPEAHLHPKAQSHLIKFICKELAEKDVQLFVETHSEHIINGIRICTLKKDSLITHNDVCFYFFDMNYCFIKLNMDENAQIDNWPTGFFDQQEIDLAEILKLGLLK